MRDDLLFVPLLFGFLMTFLTPSLKGLKSAQMVVCLLGKH